MSQTTITSVYPAMIREETLVLAENADIAAQDANLREFLIGHATDSPTYLLAHADDGVIWGRVDYSAGNQKTLTIGSDVLSDDFRGVSPRLTLTTLQTLRLFSETQELLIWRNLGEWKGRVIADSPPGDATWTECFDEDQLLWGTHGTGPNQQFTLLSHGREGLRHAIPLPISATASGKVFKLKHPVKLRVRHYLNTDGTARRGQSAGQNCMRGIEMTHSNPTKPDRIACAPYNFIPLPERVVKAVESADELPDHNSFNNPNYPHSGYIDVELTTESPLYIRGPLTRAEKSHDLSRRYRDGHNQIDVERPEYKRLAKNKPEFFHIDPGTKQPVIPGSSLRGMLRSVIEIATYSKFKRFNDRRLIFRAVADTTSLGALYREMTLGPNTARDPQRQMAYQYPKPQLKAGYLRRNGDSWGIQPAVEHVGESFVHVDYNSVSAWIGGKGRWRVHDVFVTPVGRTNPNRGNRHGRTLFLNLAISGSCVSAASMTTAPAGMVKGKLIESGHIGKKHMHCVIFEKNKNTEPIEIAPRLRELYEEDCELSRGPNTRILANDGDPLFYLLDDSDSELIYFGSTLFFRLPYDRSIADCIPKSASAIDVVDFADALWGFTNDDHKTTSCSSGYSSRIQISDAQIVDGQEDISAKAITPKILASPKPTCFQHYLVQDQPDEKRSLSHYGTPISVEERVNGKWKRVQRGSEPRIRGSKRYWHQQGVTVSGISAPEPRNGISKQNTQLQAVNRKKTFSFRIHFRNLNSVELGALLWCIDVHGANRERYAHQLGMAKPYGFGAVRLTISRCLVTNRAIRYQSLVNESGWSHGQSKMSDADMDKNKEEFKSYICRKLDLEENSYHSLPRIGTLLAMMETSGLSSVVNGLSRYMTIQPNEYRERPVLPSPLAFLGRDTQRLASSSEPSHGIARSRDTKRFRFDKGDKINVKRLPDESKGKKTKPKFVSTADAVPARFLNNADIPAEFVVDYQGVVVVVRTESAPPCYVVRQES